MLNPPRQRIWLCDFQRCASNWVLDPEPASWHRTIVLDGVSSCLWLHTSAVLQDIGISVTLPKEKLSYLRRSISIPSSNGGSALVAWSVGVDRAYSLGKKGGDVGSGVFTISVERHDLSYTAPDNMASIQLPGRWIWWVWDYAGWIASPDEWHRALRLFGQPCVTRIWRRTRNRTEKIKLQAFNAIKLLLPIMPLRRNDQSIF